MTVPGVVMTEIDGALGVQSPTTRTVAVVGCCSTGTAATPKSYSRSSSMRSVFGVGPISEMASRCIDQYGLTVLMVRAAAATDGAMGTTDDTGVTGTATVTSTTGAEPLDAYEVYCEVITGGALGTAGIVVKPSLDNGRTFLAPIALGTGLTLVIPGTGVSFTLASSASTLVAGDSWTCATTAPMWDSTSIGAALDALAASSVEWDSAIICGDLTGTLFDAVAAKFATMYTAGKYHWWQGHFRNPTSGESEATYLAAAVTALGAKSSSMALITAGAERFTSNVSGAVYTRPALYSEGPRVVSLSQEIDPAWIDLGPLPGTDIRDEQGNVLHHDEAENPGLDDARFTTLCTIEGYTGVYINNARLFSAAGSDFQYVQHRRVMNEALKVTRTEMVRVLSSPIRVNRITGKILELDRKRIEDRLNSKLRGRIMAKPMASDVYAVVAADANLLSGERLTVDTRVVPLAYPKTISASVGFVNPALQKV